jgi:hypothetical protein
MACNSVLRTGKLRRKKVESDRGREVLKVERETAQRK